MDKKNEENTRNEQLLEGLRMKDEYLDKALEHYRPMSTREINIWMDGWAACETVKGLMDLKHSKD